MAGLRMLAFGLTLCLVACSAQPGAGTPNMVAAFGDMTDSSFSVEAVAPPEVIREYAICKATWFAEHKKTKRLWLSDPVYGKAPSSAMVGPPPPATWMSLKATAYMDTPHPSTPANVDVAEKAAQCRSMWDWYR